MRVAIVGSRSLTEIDLDAFVPPEATEIISGGARGVDQLAKRYAAEHHLQYTEFLPDYAHYRRSAPLKRNDEIIRQADLVLIFWDGRSPGTEYVIGRCTALGKPQKVFMLE